MCRGRTGPPPKAREILDDRIWMNRRRGHGDPLELQSGSGAKVAACLDENLAFKVAGSSAADGVFHVVHLFMFMFMFIFAVRNQANQGNVS